MSQTTKEIPVTTKTKPVDNNAATVINVIINRDINFMTLTVPLVLR